MARRSSEMLDDRSTATSAERRSAEAGHGSGPGSVRQFVTFGVASEMFAVPLAQVQEIIRYPDVVRAPLGPAALEGLGNLRGSILPILSLRCILGAAVVAHGDATRVVVLDGGGRPVGLVVDRMASVVTAEPDRIEMADAIRTTVASDLLTGVIKGSDEAIVMILDAGTLIQRQFTAARTSAKSAHAGATERAAPEAHERSEQVSEMQLVSFAVAGQEYALPIEQVQEIVQVPARVTEVPNSGRHVLGVMTLRDRLLSLVSLRRMFGMADAELTAANKIVVVSPAPGVAVGLVMDSVREVLRVSRSVIDPIPEMLARSSRDIGDITAICRLAGGTRLVSILSAERLFDLNNLRELAAASSGMEADRAEGEITGEAMGESGNVVDDEEQLVVFRVMNEEYAVPIESVQEIVRVPDALVRVPNTPDFIKGLINLRGAVLPVVDQRRRFGLEAARRNDRQRIVVFAIHGLRTGFIVDSVSQVVRVPVHLIGPAPELCAEQRRLIRRVANLAEQQRMILMLEVDQLLDMREVGALAEAAAA
jgi:purine-binding chemotaxis protein CheW